MKRTKRLVSMLLMFVMLWAMIPFNSFAMPESEASSARVMLEAQVQDRLDASDDVTLIIELEDPGLGDIRLMSPSQQLSETARIEQMQTGFVQQMNRQAIQAEEVYRYHLLFNGISFETTWEDALRIADLPGVKRAELAAEYDPPEIYPMMSSSKGLVHSEDAWELGFKGQGRLIAVLDSGADPLHQDFVLSDDTVPMYPTEDSVRSIISTGNMSGRWFNEKIPYGYNYSDNNDQIKEELKASGMHGMHVAGTVAANGEVMGIAPEAQLLILRVFGEAGGGTNASIYLKAIEDAVLFKADSVNMSLGSPSGVVGDITGLVVDAIDRAAALGTVINIAGGNEGQFAYTYDLPYATAPDYGVIGAPSVTPMSLSVASMENDSLMLAMIELADGTKIPYQISDSSIAPNYGQAYDIVDGGLGRVEDLADLDLSGKIALIERGENTFVEKANNAHAKGAVAVLIYNHVEGGDAFINMSMAEARIPGLSIRRSDALALIASPQSLSILTEVGEVESATKGYMSDFSNWGISTEFDLKPEIAAPGGNIYSTLNDDLYGTMSGTSMATPHVAGGVSLVHQRVLQDFPDIEGTARYHLIKNLLMSYAVPQLDPDSETVVSPRKQGAGLMNLSGAVTGELQLLATNNQAKLLLGDVTDQFTLEFSVKNLGDQAVTLPARVSLITDQVSEGRFSLTPKSLADWTVDDVVVPAGETVAVSLPVDASEFSETLAEQMPNGYFLEGYVFLGEGEQMLSLPFVGFRGVWNDVPVIEPLIYDYDDLSVAAPQYYTTDGKDFSHFYTDLGVGTKILGEVVSDGQKTYDESLIGISPNGDRNYDKLQFRGTFLRNYRDVQLRIYPADSDTPIFRSYISGVLNTGKKNHFSGRATWYKSETNHNWSWDGKANTAVADGDYLAEIGVKLNRVGAEEQVIQTPFKVDTTAPIITQVVYDNDSGRLSFVVSDGSGIGIADTTVTIANRTITPEADGSYLIGSDVDTTTVRIVSTDHVMNKIDERLSSLLIPDTQTGSIVIRGETTDGSAVPDFTTKVVNSQGEIQTNLSDLAYDSYTVTVETVQAGYEVANGTQTVELSETNRQANVVFRFSKLNIPTERVTLSVSTLPSSETYPQDIQFEAVDAEGNRYLSTQDDYLPRYHDLDLPYGDYTIRLVSLAEGWLSDPAELQLTIAGPVDVQFVRLVKGPGGTIEPIAKDATDNLLSGIRYQAINADGNPVDATATLPFGTYYVAPKEDSIPEGMYPDPAYKRVDLSETAPIARPEFIFHEQGDVKGSLTLVTNKAEEDYPEIDIMYLVEDYYGNRYYDLDRLAPGTYYVRAAEYPPAYIISPAQRTVTITPDEPDQTVAFTYQRMLGTGNGRLSVWLDGHYTMREGGTLDIIGSDGTVYPLSFTSYSSMLNINLPYDHYVVRAGELPAGYYIVEDYISVVVDSGYASVDVTLAAGDKPEVRGRIDLFSLEAGNRTALSGAIYEIKNSAGEVVTDYTSLALGEYTVQVLTPPAGYVARQANQTITLSLNEPYGKLFFYYEPGEALPYVVSVAETEPMEVEYATPFAELMLPETLPVTLSDETVLELAIEWQPGDYDAQTPGVYELVGTLDLSGHDITNPQAVMAYQTVTVLEEVIPAPAITSVPSLPDRYMPYGTDFEDLSLPETVWVVLDNEERVELPVVWQAGDYDPTTPGSYRLVGTLTLPEDGSITNPEELALYQTIIVLEELIPVQPIVSLETFETITVDHGTAFSDLDLPSLVKATLADGSLIDLAIDWSAEGYRSDVAGEYILSGQLVIPEVVRVSNPDELMARQNVIVLEALPAPAEVVAVETLEPISVDYGTRYRELTLPETVTITLDNDNTIQAALVWSKGDYDGLISGSYQLSGSLVLPEGVINPLGLTATQEVIVGEQAPRTIVAVEALSPIKLTLGQTEDDARLPQELVVVLSDQTTTRLPVVWQLSEQHATRQERISLYQATIQLSGEQITNPDNLMGYASVIVPLPQTDNEVTRRIAGDNRYETAAKVALEMYDRAEVVVLASGVDFPDALSASPLAHKLQAPLLLSAPDHLPQSTLAALDELNPQKVLLLGGEKALSGAIANELRELGITAERLGGDTRYHTASLIAHRLSKATDHAYLVNGEQFADAISIGASASMASQPILLSDAKTLPEITRKTLIDLGVEQVSIIGGELAISPAVADELEELGIEVNRLAGSTRYLTNDVIVRQDFPQAEAALIASGETFADALCASLLAAKLEVPLLITQSDKLSEPVAEWIQEFSLEQATLLGGPLALSENVRLSIERLILQ